MRETFKKGSYNSSKRVHQREANMEVEKATRRMYSMLHETEHRILHIQAGGTYKAHVAACQVQPVQLPSLHTYCIIL